MSVPSLREDLTFWSPVARDSSGNVTFSSPTLVKAQTGRETKETTTADGKLIITQNFAYVAQAIEEDFYVLLGDFSASPLRPTELGARTVNQVTTNSRAPNRRKLFF